MSVTKRMKKIIYESIKRDRLNYLEFLSGIKASSWGNALGGKQRATEEMIEFSCRKWPDKALWICTGLSDESLKALQDSKKRKKLELNLFKSEPISWTPEEATLIEMGNIDGSNLNVDTKIMGYLTGNQKLEPQKWKDDWSVGKYQAVKVCMEARKNKSAIKEFIEEELKKTDDTYESMQKKIDIELAIKFFCANNLYLYAKKN